MVQRTGYCEKCFRVNPESEGTELAIKKGDNWHCVKCDAIVEILPEELKNCPFCNGEGFVCTTNPSAWWISCEDCGAEAEAGDNLEAGVSNWNRRA